ncbi:hypothetical protein QWI17_07895 [Gilvimarinus sp. SDUM040013]|uniref:DUF2059 domain-containing protein n=1 Tax=Gilvimarinus gilvus TaxID=3058038 RepID=A0ABU4RX46_9GAMM|nr:hypothetical protein [Gilvimarinus sp. SDUM040013]MDO3385755.1 hypothetical protein [Gilvimarinus sp. SDUM040013]MDX6849395.1 hypothetical protein [Gilvimarinus sp. SDUM040013]
MKFSLLWVKGMTIVVLALLSSIVMAERELNAGDVDAWLATTEQLMPMQDVFEKMGQGSTIADEYTEEEFKALSIEKQDEVMDDMLKEQGAYDQIYAVLNEYEWPSAGEYMRVSSRIGMAIAARMRDQMMKSLPAEQRQMMEEMSGPVNANPADVALVESNWDKVSQFMGKYMQAPK